MVNMEDEDYFHSLSRRELQDLCRINGLPANKTKSHLAKLLASCYQRKKASSAALEERSSSLIDGWPFTTPGLNVASELNPMGETSKGVHDARVEAADVDSRRSSTSKVIPISAVEVVRTDPSINGTAEVYGCSNFDIQETTGCSLLGSQCDDVGPKLKNKDTPESVEAKICSQNLTSPARSTGLGEIQQIHLRNMNPSDIPTNSSFISSGTVTNLLPNFEFHVSSEEGINLFVDLNSSPLDWIKKLNDGVCIHPEVLNNKSWALHHELRSLGGDDAEAKALSLGNTVVDFKNKGDPAFTNSLLDSIVKEGSHVNADQPDRPSVSTHTNTSVESLGLIEEKNNLNSFLCEPNDVHNPMNACMKSSPQSSEKFALGSEAALPSQTTSATNLDTGPKADGVISPDLLEHQSKSLNTSPEITDTGFVGTSSIPHARRLPLSSEVLETFKPLIENHGKGSEPSRGCSTSGDSMEMQSSEVVSLCEDMSNLPSQNGGTHDRGNLMHFLQDEIGRSANCELDLNKSLDPLSEYPEGQRSNLTDETESSECSQLDMKAKNCKRSSSSDSEGQNKRQHKHAEDSNTSIKNIRNAKDSVRGIRPRRSMRLVSK